MFIGHFTERPYQDADSGVFGVTARPVPDLGLGNEVYDPRVGAELYNRYLDERVYAEEVGFDGVMLNEHHSTPFCNIQACTIVLCEFDAFCCEVVWDEVCAEEAAYFPECCDCCGACP